AERLTSVPGASQVFGFGAVVYSGEAKRKLLKIDPALIKTYGEVSEEVTSAMAKAIQKISKSDYALAVTGIAGPKGGTALRPVGTVCFSLLSPRRQLIKKLLLRGRRNEIRDQASRVILNALLDDLKTSK
ncbi:MAG: CinA family protein, partial [Deltaproteobacteria bacterium]